MLAGDAETELPLLQQLLLPQDRYEARTRAFANSLAKRWPAPAAAIEVERDRVPVGGGSLPAVELDSWVVSVRDQAGAEVLARRLRESPTPILARVQDDVLWIDLRTVDEADDVTIENALVDTLR